MYQIDINFLNDRQDFVTAGSSGTFVAEESKTPLIIGGAVAGGLVGLVLLMLGGTALVNQQLASREQALDSDLNQLAPELAKIEELLKEENIVKAETSALATIFNQIKPWSAMLQDMRDRVPPTLQITRIEQIAPPPPPEQPAPNGEAPAAEAPADPAAPPAPAQPVANSDLKIGGNALSFSDINDFELTLRKSPFLTAGETKLMTSQRNSNDQTGISLVEYDINSEINSVPASELMQVLSAKGAPGLVARIQALKSQGVMKP